MKPSSDIDMYRTVEDISSPWWSAFTKGDERDRRKSTVALR
jgi:hypothetical protein